MSVAQPFELLLFHRSVEENRACLDAGVAAIIIDFERRGKADRQVAFDTEINSHGIEDLRAVKRELNAYVICRVNPPGPDSKEEIRAVLGEGADEILVPMVRSLDEAEGVLRSAGDPTKVALMIETKEAVDIAAELGQLPAARFYLGLNDLRISRGTPSIFSAFMDGTVERVRGELAGACFGVAGLTLPGKGSPFPVRHLFNELARLECNFTFLRRSFYRDIAGKSPAVEVPRILETMAQARRRPPAVVEQEREECYRALADLVAES